MTSPDPQSTVPVEPHARFTDHTDDCFQQPDEDRFAWAERFTAHVFDAVRSSRPVTATAGTDGGNEVEQHWYDEPKPDHPWNDPDEDGHDCADCGPTSMWKCDRFAHLLGGMRGPMDLLTAEQKADLNRELAEGAAVRRRGSASARDIPLAALPVREDSNV